MHLPQGHFEARPTPGGRVTYSDLRPLSLLRQSADAATGWHWALDPYEGCEFACTFCRLRLDRKEAGPWRDFERKVGVKANAVELLVRELRALDADAFKGHPIAIGSGPDPWQPAEEHFRLTRNVLSQLVTMADELERFEGLELRLCTRASLIARDTDLIRALSHRVRVQVVVSIASIDERINRLVEPKAPSSFRRLAGIEALARAGVSVGLMVSPVMAGLDEDELGLVPLLTRAANAGARAAGLTFMQLGPGQRENFLAQVTDAFPEQASRFRRVIGRRSPTPDEEAPLRALFARTCAHLGLEPIGGAPAPRAPARSEPAQLALFGG